MERCQPIDPTRLWEIHGRYYDLEPFFTKHPGGRRLLEQARGMDCTALFESTHLHDKIPKATLKSFYVGDNPAYQAMFDWQDDGFFPTLKARVRDHFRAASPRAGASGRAARRDLHGTRAFLVRFGVLWLCFIALGVGAIGYGSWLCAALWAPVSFALGGYGHEAMHHGMFVSPWANRAAAFFTIDLMGLSAFVFTGVHVPLHHVETNVEGKDPDIEVHYPLIRERETQPARLHHRFQHVYVWLLYAITFHVLLFIDIFAAATGTWLGPWGKIRRPFAREWALLLVSKAIAVFVFYVLPFLLQDFRTALGVHVLMLGVSGLIVQTTFACNHQNDLAMNLDHRKSRHPRDWGALQLETTADFQHGHWLPTMFFGGLGYQIEHHLFPTLSYSRLADIAPIVRATCKEFGVPYFYYVTGAHAFAAHYRFLKRMGRRSHPA